MRDAITLPSYFAVACHTDNIGPGSTFVAIQGMTSNGVDFIPEAVKRGASRIVVEANVSIPEDIVLVLNSANVTVEYVPNARLALAHLSAQANNYPAQKLRIIAITGTKGKTTTSFLLEHIFRTAGHKTALISTVKNSINGNDLPAPLTTPQPDYLHTFLRCCVDEGVTTVIMEVAAQALSLHRTAGITFDAALFTNFSLEHLEFYPSMDEYFAAKKLLFAQCKPGAPFIINADDAHGQQLLALYPDAISYGLDEDADIEGIVGDRINLNQGMAMMITYDTRTCISQDSDNTGPFVLSSSKHKRAYPSTSSSYAKASEDTAGRTAPGPISITSPHLLGTFNAYNILAATSTALQFLINPKIITRALATFPGVPGRLQKYKLPNGALGIIDYAHNPSSYEALFSLLKKKNNNLIVIFGAGGKRDPSKRPIMGAIAAQFADTIILTSDNPRDEDPARIIDDIVAGITPAQQHRVIRELDREQAIKKAYALSNAQTIIAILGKGTDEYQIIGTQKIPFSEERILESL